MKSFLKVLKEDKGSRLLFLIFAILILLGIACLIFALYHP